jgi:hypothetical protein
MALAFNANAKQDDKEAKDEEKKVEVVESLPAPKPDKPFSVPDAGFTAALLGPFRCFSRIVAAQNCKS